MAAIVGPTEHGLRITSLAGVQANARFALKLQRVVCCTLEIVLACRQCAPRPQPPLRDPVVFKNIQFKRVDVSVSVVADNDIALEVTLAVAAVA
jgi:hypothetical protein